MCAKPTHRRASTRRAIHSDAGMSLMWRNHGAGGKSPAPVTPSPNFAKAVCVFLLRRVAVIKFLLWCILLVLCWPLALLALVLYPIIWLLLLPFRLVGIAVGAVLDLVWAIVTLPARLVRSLGRA